MVYGQVAIVPCTKTTTKQLFQQETPLFALNSKKKLVCCYSHSSKIGSLSKPQWQRQENVGKQKVSWPMAVLLLNKKFFWGYGVILYSIRGFHVM